ncbi:hypothetical protein BN77_1402 [Rhizobium mesoamericanum STM3625]|uniref:Uncharacterized protein n=1 Tax=Rhizobium mesoamericanum STM3625 TaxID=1211777 RepID=K0PWU1_9HYPH|nr:hypothetical protein BN77_1402 [Rhizobium mesoamericanum STM3625]
MRKSSGFLSWIEGLPGSEHGPQDGDASAGQDDDGLGVMFSLWPFPVVEGFGEWVSGGDGAEGTLEEYPLEGLIAAKCAAPVPGFSGLADDGRQPSGIAR